MSRLNETYSISLCNTAILVDGAFFLKRYKKCYKKGYTHKPETVAKNFFKLMMKHVQNENLYRIFYYDCPPLNKKLHNPISGSPIDYSKSKISIFKNEFLSELKKLRKVALRLGVLMDNNGWRVHTN